MPNNAGSQGQFFIGVVENRNDPLMIGRCKVRIVGLHTHDKTALPTSDLPWAMLMQPVSGPSSGGIGHSAIGPVEGTTVVVIFHDYPDCQQPIIIGVLGGVPQGNPVNIDKFDDTPLFKDAIAPQGRKIPITAAEATANQIGPTEGATNPLLSAISNQSVGMGTKTPMGVLGTFFGGNSALAYGATGGMLSGLNTLGSTYAPGANMLAGMLLKSGNSDQAISTFKSQLTQSPLGLGITNLMNGKGSLKSLQRDLGLNIFQIQNQFNSLKNVNLKDPSSIIGLANNVQSLAYQAGSLVSGGTSILAGAGSYADRVFGTTIGSTVASLGGSLTATVTGITSGVGGLIGGAESWVGRALSGDFSAFNFDSVNGLFQNNSIVNSLFGEGTSSKYPDAGIDSIKAIPTTQSLGTIDSSTFKNVAEGSSFPINGVYGGPNSGGQKAPITAPKIDMTRYEGGSKGNIQTVPPPDWKGDRAKATQGIQALLNACQKRGFTTNEQKAALLGIVGGECGWIPQSESAQYSSPDRLCEIFQSSFKGDRTLAEKYCNWTKGAKGSKAEFFDFIYDPSRNGRQLGNTRPGDGGKFYGRGFIQLTGRSNYERYAEMSGHDIVNNPDLLNNDINISADIAVLYLMDRTKGAVPTSHPGFFYAAKKSVGNNSPDIAARKLAYYEHFYGVKAAESFGYTEKQAGPTLAPYSYDGAQKGNEAGKPITQGFQDPNGKYPLKRTINEPDTHRLARGIIKETIVALKDSKRRIGVPMANNKGNWSQPTIPFGAQYPYNTVMETEAGHVQEWDDTPGYERVHTYHKSGTFDEIDVNGTRVNRIVGDGYTIIDNNGYISIDGEASITVGGNINVYCRSDANIQVEGSAELVVGGNFDIGVARDMNIAVGGKFSLWSSGGMNLQTEKMAHILSNHKMYISSNNEMNLTSYNNMLLHAKQAMHVESNGNLFLESVASTHMKSGSDFFILSAGKNNIKAAGDSFIESGGTNHFKGAKANVQATSGKLSLKASGTLAFDGAGVAMQSSQSDPATGSGSAEGAETATKALINGMTPPANGAPLYPQIQRMSSPAMFGEETFMYESDTAGKSEASQAYVANMTAQNGKSNTYKSEEVAGTGGGGSIIPSKNQEKILAATDFSADYKLSEHFTLGMMFDGGYNVRHRLVDQNGLTKQQIVANMAALCENILEKYLAELPGGIAGYNKQWRITSGFRMGTNTSDHSKGRACDIQIIGRSKPAHHELIQKLDKIVPYDQLILEYAGSDSVWIHTGFRGDGKTTFGGGQNRKMAFTMNNHSTYGQGFVLLG